MGYVGDELVGYYWWVDRRIEPRHRDIADYGLDIELGERDVYGFDFFLLEEHRGGGNSMAFLNTVETLLRDLGYGPSGATWWRATSRRAGSTACADTGR